MLLRSVATKSLFDQRRGLFAWTVSLVLLVAMYVAIWPSIRDQPAMADFVNSMRWRPYRARGRLIQEAIL